MRLSVEEKKQLDNVKAIIEADIQKHYTIDDLAAIALMSRSKLIRVYRMHFGMALFEHLQGKRLSLAKTLLDNSSLSIKQIAQKCGYHHACNFSTAFKHNYGVSPSAYRQG